MSHIKTKFLELDKDSILYTIFCTIDPHLICRKPPNGRPEMAELGGCQEYKKTYTRFKFVEVSKI